MQIDHDNLEEFQDPANYDLEEQPGSAQRVAMLCGLAARIGGPALELACGTGIVALELAAQGMQVAGVDLARPMLDHARRKAELRGLAIELSHGDARSADLGRTFQLVLLTGNAFQAFLSRADQELLLATVRRHLAPGGRFVFETRNPTGHDLRDQLEPLAWKTYTDIAGQLVTVSEAQRYDALAQVLHWTTYRSWDGPGGPQTRVTRIACRFTYPQELEALLHYNGLTIEEQYGDWGGGPVAPQSPALISVCRAR